MIFNMTGGASLNFQVKTYPSETELKADNPKENTIGIITTTTMTSWVFSATEPTEPKTGMVWIAVGASSSVEFNALKNNTLQVYPLKAKQYEGGKRVDKVAYSYQNGEWVEFIKYLINGNDLCEGITGGWTAHAKVYNAEVNKGDTPVLTKNSDSVTIRLSQTGFACGLYATTKKINLDNVDKLYINAVGNGVNNNGGETAILLYSAIGNLATENTVAYVGITTEDKTHELPVTDYDGEYFVVIRLLSTNSLAASITIKEIRME